MCVGKRRLQSFGINSIKSYIPRIWLDFLDSLAIVRKADEFWMKPVTPEFQERKGAVEVAAAHADAMPGLVKRDERCDDDVDVRGRDLVAGYGLPKAEVIPDERRFTVERSECHLPVGRRNRYKNALARAPRALDDRGRIDLVPDGDIAGKRPGGEKVAAREESIGDASGCERSIFRRERTARPSGLAPQSGLHHCRRRHADVCRSE